jgi:hypothetical protein
MKNERQFLVIDLDGFGGVERLCLGLRHDGDDRLAHMAYLVGRQQHVRTDEDRAAAGGMELHVVFGLRHRIVRNGVQPLGEVIGAAVRPDHARHDARCRKIHAANACMRVGRSHHCEVALTRRRKIIAEATGAGSEPGVLLARQGGADETKLRRRWLVHESSAERMAAPSIARSAVAQQRNICRSGMLSLSWRLRRRPLT